MSTTSNTGSGRYVALLLTLGASLWALTPSACRQATDSGGGGGQIVGDTADPTQLPAATGQHPAAGTYGRSLAAGQKYTDPNSGVTVLKLTSATVPAANGGMYHGYSEGGPNISLPWVGSDSETYYTAKVGAWLVDIKISTMTSSNWRPLSYDGEIGIAFSLNPATPRIAYKISNGTTKRVDRYNTATNAVENTGNWPWTASATGTNMEWLQNNLNDTWFAAMLNSNHTVVAFRPSDGLQRAITEAGSLVSIDEPHLDREFPYIYLSTNSPVPNKIVNLETAGYTIPNDTAGINADDHAAPMRGRIVALSWIADGIISVNDAGGVLRVTSAPSDWSGDWHMAGQWVYNNPNQYFVLDQWKDVGAYPIYLGMVGFVSLTGDVRLIAATDATGTGYNDGGQPHPTLAPDGKLVMWVTNMNGSARYDTFIARIPTK